MSLLIVPNKSRFGGSTNAHRETAATTAELSNSVTSLDADLNFETREGIYKAQETIFVATPLPHPSDNTVSLANHPLAPTSHLASYYSRGPKISVAVLAPAPSASVTSSSPSADSKQSQKQQSNSLSRTLGFGSTRKNSLRKSDSTSLPDTPEVPAPSSPNNASSNPENSAIDQSEPAPASNNSNARKPVNRRGSFSGVSTTLSNTFNSGLLGGSNKKKRPKNSLLKNNSTFLSRIVAHNNLAKRLTDRNPEEAMIWINVGRSFSWFDMSQASRSIRHEPLSRMLLTRSHPLCHHLNDTTKAHNFLELVIGTSPGDILWVEHTSHKYNRMNKNGVVVSSAATDVRWMPNSENYFVAGFANGQVAIFDKEREDSSGLAAEKHSNINGSTDSNDSSNLFKVIKSRLNSNGSAAAAQNYNRGSVASTGSTTSSGSSASAGSSASHGINNSTNNSKHNPVALFQMSNRPISSLTFSPNGSLLAVTSNDGYLRLLDLSSETLTDVFPSYYSGFLCSAFSPDGEYLVTGGQDDLISIWSLTKKSLVARGQGHHSWVSKVAFDPYMCDSTDYRIGSVGEEGSLLLWDFSPQAVGSRLKSGNLGARRASSTALKSVRSTLHTSENFTRLKSNASEDPTGASPLSSSYTCLHPLVPKDKIPFVVPHTSTSVSLVDQDPEPLSDLVFLPDSILTAGQDGRVWKWSRPDKASKETKLEPAAEQSAQ